MSITMDELVEWQKTHPEESRHACARFDEQVHLTRFLSRAWVDTWCGLSGSAKDHALVFRLPRASVNCQACLRLSLSRY